MDGVRGSTGGKKRTGRMLSRGEGEAGRRGERGLNGGREQRSVKPGRLILRPVI